MPKKSAGILLYRFATEGLEVFLAHPGGPFWRHRDESAWSIPKGEFEDELPLNAAIREFEEETGIQLSGDFIPLTAVMQKGGKQVYAFAQERNIDPKTCTSNTFQLEWPPKSGHIQEFPEVDRCAWFDLETAMVKINASQAQFLQELKGYVEDRNMLAD